MLPAIICWLLYMTTCCIMGPCTTCCLSLSPCSLRHLAHLAFSHTSQVLIKLGDKEVDWNPDFKLYITTKLANPHYTPEISTKVMIVNFAVKEQGLEAQLLSTVVKNERPDLDKQKNDLVIKVAAGKRTQVSWGWLVGTAFTWACCWGVAFGHVAFGGAAFLAE